MNYQQGTLDRQRGTKMDPKKGYVREDEADVTERFRAESEEMERDECRMIPRNLLSASFESN